MVTTPSAMDLASVRAISTPPISTRTAASDVFAYDAPTGQWTMAFSQSGMAPPTLIARNVDAGLATGRRAPQRRQRRRSDPLARGVWRVGPLLPRRDADVHVSHRHVGRGRARARARSERRRPRRAAALRLAHGRVDVGRARRRRQPAAVGWPLGERLGDDAGRPQRRWPRRSVALQPRHRRVDPPPEPAQSAGRTRSPASGPATGRSPADDASIAVRVSLFADSNLAQRLQCVSGRLRSRGADREPRPADPW